VDRVAVWRRPIFVSSYVGPSCPSFGRAANSWGATLRQTDNYSALSVTGVSQAHGAKGHSDGGAEILYRRKDGSEFWAALFISPVQNENGDVVQYFASFVDLSKHKEQQAESKMLIDELNHRVKNTLSSVQSIVRQALQTGSDSKVIRESIETRLLRYRGRMTC
jgi:HWE histidine kinase